MSRVSPLGFVALALGGLLPLEGQQAAVADPDIREGVEIAVEKTLKPAAAQKAYPGHFSVTADGRVYGAENTWPGLDSWQLAGAYLLLGERRLVLDYFDFVQASQRADGNIPFAIVPAESPPPHQSSYFRGLHYPKDVYTYTPKAHPDQPASANRSARKWIGLFDHWQLQANPLGILAAASYVLTASEIFSTIKSEEWLAAKLGSIEAAGKYLLSRKSANGLVSGAGFYTELPPRHQWDGIAQCYSVHVFRHLSQLNAALKKTDAAASWSREADVLADAFRATFWKQDHFAEYVHPDRGVVDLHGLSDVNWAAVAFDIATAEQVKLLWPKLLAEAEFWRGDMPTQSVSKPFAYEEWELNEPLPFELPNRLTDVAAMGRVWYLEALACLKMKDPERLRKSVRKVCLAGKKDGGQWRERYHPLPAGGVAAHGPQGYCEYPAILVRIVLGHPEIFAAGSPK